MKIKTNVKAGGKTSQTPKETVTFTYGALAISYSQQ